MSVVRPKMWEKQREALNFAIDRAEQGKGVALFLDCGCIAGDAILNVNRGGKGFKVSLQNAYLRFHGLSTRGRNWDPDIQTYTRALCGETFNQHKVLDIVYKGLRPIVRLTLASGKTLGLTPDHEIACPDNRWVAVKNLISGDHVVTNGIYVRRSNRPGKDNPNYKTGKSIDKDGYVLISGMQDHPRVRTNGTVLEHILVMEAALGRLLKPEERIHHVNGNKADNRIENLKLVTTHTHCLEHEWRKHLDTGHGTGIILPRIDTVVSVELIGETDVYDIMMDEPYHNFVANGIVVHNCGKTRISIHWLEHLFATKEAKLVYVAAPLSALHVWIENWHLWAKAPVAFIDLHESGSAGLRKAQELAADGWPVICLCNYEAAWQLGYKRILRKRQGEEVRILEKVDTAMHDLPWDVGILDESTFIKSPGSKVSKFFRRKMAPRTAYRMILSGSAYVKRPLDVWAPCNFAVGAEIFAPAFLPFKMEYSIPHQYIRGAILGYKNLGDLVNRLAKIAVMLKKTDVLDLPPFVHETRMVELGPKSRKVYQDLVDEALAELDTGEVTSDHVFTMIRKLAQITSGFVYPDCDPETPDIKPAPVRLGTEKLDVLMEILENRDSPTVVIVQMDEEERMIVEAVQKRFKFTPKVLNGSVHGAEARHKMIESAAQDPVFIMKESVGARGIDVKFADLMVFYSHSYNTEAYTQILSRNHRGGQTHSITYIHLLAKSTIDLKIMKALEKDLSLADSIERDWRKLFE